LSDSVTTVTTFARGNTISWENREASAAILSAYAFTEKGGDSGDSGDNVEIKGFFLSPPWKQVVTGGDTAQEIAPVRALDGNFRTLAP